MNKAVKLLLAGALACAVCGLAFYLAARQRAERALAAAGREMALESPRARLIGEVPRDRLYTSPPGITSITRPLPVNAAALFEGRAYLGTDGGLVEKGPAGFRLLTMNNGLPATRVTALAAFKDRLVIGTDDGVAVLTPDSLLAYRMGKREANSVSCLAPGQDRLLIGTLGGGLLIYDGSGFKYHPAFADQKNLMVSAAWEGEDRLAVGAWRAGLIVSYPGGRTALGMEQGVVDPVTAILPDGDGLLFGTPLGLLRHGPSGLAVVAADASVSDLARSGDEIIVASFDRGLLRISERRLTPLADRGSPARLARLGDDLYALGHAVYKIEGKTARDVTGEMVPAPGPLSDNRLTSLAVDDDGRLWVGGFESGVDVLDRSMRREFSLAKPDHLDVNCVYPDPQSSLMWVGSGRGLLAYSGASLMETLGEEQGLIGPTVFAATRDGARIVAATNRGVGFHSPSSTRGIGTFHGLVNNHVYCLAVFDGAVFAGTLGGLSRIEGARVTASYNMDNSTLRHNWVTSLYPLGDVLFAGTFGGGVAALDRSGQWRDLACPVKDVNQNAMLEWEGRLMVGTFGGGLVPLRLSTREWEDPVPGLTSKNVTGLARLPDGTLAVATDRGLNLIKAGY